MDRLHLDVDIPVAIVAVMRDGAVVCRHIFIGIAVHKGEDTEEFWQRFVRAFREHLQLWQCHRKLFIHPCGADDLCLRVIFRHSGAADGKGIVEISGVLIDFLEQSLAVFCKLLRQLLLAHQVTYICKT